MDPEQLVERATALLELGRPVEAERAAHEAVAADPASSAALVVLARALTEQRRHDEGVEAARAAVALEPHEWVTHHALGWALLRTTPPHFAEARASAERALELEPGATAAHSVLGLALAGLGQRRAGRRVLREGLRMDPHDPYLHNNLAKIDLDRGLRIGRTGRHLRAAASAIPQEPVVHHNLDTLLVRFGVRLVWPTLLALFVLRVQLGLDAPWWSRALTGAAFLAVIGALVAWFAGQVPRGLRSWAPGVLRRVAVPVRLIASALIAFGVCVVAAAFAPAGLAGVAEQAAALALRLALVLAVVLVVLHLLRREGRSR